jgi:hypothetical protein
LGGSRGAVTMRDSYTTGRIGQGMSHVTDVHAKRLITINPSLAAMGATVAKTR